MLLAAGSDRQQLEWTNLMYAIVFGSLADVKNLLSKKVDLTVRDYWHRTPWLLSIQVGDIEKAKLMLSSGIDRGLRGLRGHTSIMYASENNHLKVLKWLIKEGFDLEAMDDYNTTPLILAAEIGATDCVRILLSVNISEL